MIIYFADRRMNILGQASTGLPDGIFIKNDEKTEEVEAGVSTLEFDLYFTDETRENTKKWADTGNYILRKNGDEQEFYTIIESEMSAYDKRINIYAEDAGMDLLNETVGAYTADKAYPAKYYIEKYSYDSGFELGLNEISDLSRKLSWDGETTASARLLSVATQFDAELSYTFEIDELKIKHKYINLHKKRGKDNGVELRINREVSNITEKKSVADLATGLSVTGGTPEGSEKPITLNGYKYDDGDFYVSGICVFSRKALEKWSRYLSESGNDVGHIMQVYTYDTTSQSELCNRAVSKLKKICDVSVTYEVELAYLPVGVKIGDMVDIVDDAGELYLSARIMKLVVSEANKTYTATLGDYTLKTDGISEKVLELAAQFEQLAKNRTLYTWVVFADDENGSNISINASEKEYMGIAYNRVTKKADLSVPEIYTWVKITGGQGIPGPAGKDGNDGRTSFFHVKYSDVPEPTTSQMNEKGGKYIGTYVDFDVNNSSDPKKYTWRQFEGDTGKQGEKGIPGKNGENGLTSYLHIAYATSADGKTGFSVNEPAGKTYIGQYTDFMEEDSTDPNKYAWSRTEGKKGETGNGIESTDITYQAGASGTTPPTETWTTEKPKTSADKPFFWTRMVFTYTDGTTSTAYSVGCTAEGIVEILKDQIDQKIETWYQDIDPAINWTGTEEQNLCDSNGDPILDVDNNPIVITVEIEKMQHEGDLWKNSKTSVEYIYLSGQWVEMSVPDAVFDEIDGKAQIFIDTPTTPYRIGDLWFDSKSGDLLTCVENRDSGACVTEDWQKKTKYTDDSGLNSFVTSIYDPKIAELQAQIDGQIETWYYDYEPTLQNEPALQWTTTEERTKHAGDLFYWSSMGFAYRFMKEEATWKWQLVQDTDITKALAAAEKAQDTADHKRRVFVVEPKPPYDIGDLWVQGNSGDILRCCVAKSESATYLPSDWEKASKYTDDTRANEIKNELDALGTDLQEQLDGKIETFSQEMDPSTAWTEEQKNKHKGDLWYNTKTESTQRWTGTSWLILRDAEAKAAQSLAMTKKRVFSVIPYTPYDKDDLWVQGVTGDLMRCINSRGTGEYVASDWTRATKYTDDSAVEKFIQKTYTDDIKAIKNQIDQKIETWYQDTDPAINWTGTEEQNLCDSNGDPILDVDNNPIVITVEIEKMQHEGDLWKNSKTSEEYIYKHGNWQLMPIPDAVFDEIDGKSSIYVSQPIPPYNVGDAWFSGTDILTCVVERDSGEFVASDWQKKNNYTDDATVTDFIENIYDPKIADIQNQIDGKIDTYYYDYEPKNTNPPASSWTTAVEKQKHNGDLFFWKSKGYTYRYLKVDTDYQWVRVKDADIESAMTAASNAQDTADGKRRVFVTEPVPPYDIGDLWSQGTKGELMRCIIAKKSGGYEEKDWEKATKYTDNSELKKFNEELNQSELFNRLTNNGLEQGIFLKDKKIYINFSYAEGGTLKLGGVDNADGTLVVRDASGNEVGSWTKEGLDVKKGVISGSKIVLNNTLTDPAYISGMYEGTETLRINASGIKLGSNSVFNPKESQFVFDMHPFMFPGITLKDKEKGAGYGCSWTPKTFGILYSEAIEGFSDALMVSANDNKILMSVDSGDNAGTRIRVSGDGGLLKNNSTMSATGIYTTGTKNRIVNTENYASRLQYCYEMPSPMFGDIGEGYTDDTGVCIVAVDDIFRETVTSGSNYYVFLQKEGPGDIWIENKTDSYFTVQGTKNMKFSWEIKAKQKGYEFERLEYYKESENDEEYINYEDVGYYTYTKYVNDLELGGEV